MASWVIRERATGDVVMETYDRRIADRLNTAKYEAVPILEYLGSLNRQIQSEKPLVLIDTDEHGICRESGRAS